MTMAEGVIPSDPAEGETSYLMCLIKLLFTVFVIPPGSFVGWLTLGVSIYIINRYRYPHCLSKASMNGKTVIITGANKGIGLETARDMAGRGAIVIMACRDRIRATMARNHILDTAGGRVEVKDLDLTCMDSVRKFAKDIQNRKIDVLINNAAVADLPQRLTDEGLEFTVATNHLGHFLLTNLLMPNLQAAKGRIVHLTSIGHSWVKSVKELDLENDMKFQLTRPLNTLEIYVVSKLYNIIFSMELDRRLRGSGVTSNAVHPGVVNTDIFNPMIARVWYGFFIKLYVRAYAKTPFEGAQTSIHVGVSEELEGVSGKYFEDCKEATPSRLAQDEGLAKKVWEISERLVKMQANEMTI